MWESFSNCFRQGEPLQDPEASAWKSQDLEMEMILDASSIRTMIGFATQLVSLN